MLLSTKKVITVLDENVKLNLKIASLRQRIPELIFKITKEHLKITKEQCKIVMDRKRMINFYLEMTEVIFDEFNMEPNEPRFSRPSDEKKAFVFNEKTNAKLNYQSAKDREQAHHKQHNCDRNVTHCTIDVDQSFIQLLDLHGTIGNSLIMESSSGTSTDLYLVLYRLSQILESDFCMQKNHREEKLDLVKSIISLVKGQLTIRKQRIEFSEGRYPPRRNDHNNHKKSATTSKGHVHDFKLNTSTAKWTIEIFPSFDGNHGLTQETNNYCVPFLNLITWGDVGLSSIP